MKTIAALTFAAYGLPHWLIERPLMRQLLRAASIAEFPDRRSLRVEQARIAAEMRATLVHTLRSRSATAPVTIAFDGWTNTRRDKVTNVLALHDGKAYYWSSIVNHSDRNTAAWLEEPVTAAITAIKKEGVLVSALVADNESVNGALHRRLLQHFPFLIRVPCAAHTLQLCVNKILDASTEVKAAMQQATTVIHLFSTNKSMRLALKSAQPTGKAKQLIRPVPTRWSSALAALTRMIELRTYIDLVAVQEASFWATLVNIAAFLKPWQIATDIVQSDRATLLDVYKQFQSLLTAVERSVVGDPFHSVRSDVKTIIINQWQEHVNRDAVIASAVLGFEDQSILAEFDANQRVLVSDWLSRFGADYLSHYSLCDSDDVVSIHNTLYTQFSQFQGRVGPFSSINDIAAKLKSSAIATAQQQHRSDRAATHYTWDARLVWYNYQHAVPELSNVAIAILSIVPSEAAVERSFSLQSEVHREKRNRLLDTAVQNEMFVRFNSQALDANEAPSGSYIQIDDDFEADDSQPIVNLFVLPPPTVDESAVIIAEPMPAIIDEPIPAIVEPEPVIIEPEPQSQSQSSAADEQQPEVESPSFDEWCSSYIAANHITAVYRWNTDRFNALQLAVSLSPFSATSTIVVRDSIANKLKGNGGIEQS